MYYTNTNQEFNIPEYSPVVEFHYAEKHYTIKAMGRFGVPPGRVGENVAILFMNEYPDKVIIVREKHILNNFFTGLAFYIALCLVIFALIILHAALFLQ